MTATSFLRQAFHAELVGIWHVDLAGTGSYCLADSPAPPEAFHDYAVHHPAVGRFLSSGALQPFEGSQEPGDRPAEGHCLAIPLGIGDSHARLVTIARPDPGFSPDELTLAGHLQPILAGVWARKPESQPTGDELHRAPPG